MILQYVTSMIAKKYTCWSDPELAINPVCEMKLLSRYVRRVTLALTLVKPADQVFMTLNSLVKTPTNHFMPGFFKTTQDYCVLSDRTSPNAVFIHNVLKNMVPEVYKQIDIIRPCPLTVCAES
jgi:hypothetical protein